MKYMVGIIGNGFDKHRNLNTNYSEFFEMIKLIYNSNNFNDFKDKLRYFYNDDYEKVNVVYDGATDLYNYVEKNISNYYLEYFINYNIKIDKWTSFELELQNIINCLNKLINNIQYEDKSIKKIENGKYSFLAKYEDYYYPIMDIKNNCKMYNFEKNKSSGAIQYKMTIDLQDPNLNKDNYSARQVLFEFLNNDFISYFYEELKIFEMVFTKYLRAFVDPFIKNNNVTYPPCYDIISYNYTSVDDTNVIHIHGSYSTDSSNIIFGIDSKNEYGNNFDWFVKSNRRLVNSTEYSKLFDLLGNENDMLEDLCVFGHSLSISDEDTLKYILTRNWNSITVYYSKEIPFNKENLIKNIKYMLGNSLYEQMVRSGNLMFKEILNKDEIYVLDDL